MEGLTELRRQLAEALADGSHVQEQLVVVQEHYARSASETRQHLDELRAQNHALQQATAQQREEVHTWQEQCLKMNQELQELRQMVAMSLDLVAGVLDLHTPPGLHHPSHLQSRCVLGSTAAQPSSASAITTPSTEVYHHEPSSPCHDSWKSHHLAYQRSALPMQTTPPENPVTSWQQPTTTSYQPLQQTQATQSPLDTASPAQYTKTPLASHSFPLKPTQPNPCTVDQDTPQLIISRMISHQPNAVPADNTGAGTQHVMARPERAADSEEEEAELTSAAELLNQALATISLQGQGRSTHVSHPSKLRPSTAATDTQPGPAPHMWVCCSCGSTSSATCTCTKHMHQQQPDPRPAPLSAPADQVDDAYQPTSTQGRSPVSTPEAHLRTPTAQLSSVANSGMHQGGARGLSTAADLPVRRLFDDDDDDCSASTASVFDHDLSAHGSSIPASGRSSLGYPAPVSVPMPVQHKVAVPVQPTNTMAYVSALRGMCDALLQQVQQVPEPRW